MKQHSLGATLVACGMVWLAVEATARAQQRPVGPNIAVIDLANVFEHHTRFQAMKEDLKREVEQAEQEIKALREEINRMAEQMQRFNPGTPDYKTLEERLASKQADLNVQMQLKKKHFLLREAKDYYTVYQEIAEEVKYFAEQNGISLVLRYSGEEVKSENPEDVLKELNKPIIYHNKMIDITQVILAEVNRRGPPRQAPEKVTQDPRQIPRAAPQGVPNNRPGVPR